MSDNIRIVNKKAGLTPLECINDLKKNEPKLAHVPVTYAGRLDPLAEGVLVLLIGDECLKKDEYLKLPKEYEVEILFGFETDTYDVMGLVNTMPKILFERSRDVGDGSRCQTIPNSNFGSVSQDTTFDEALEKTLSQFTGRIKQFYPPYSSRTVNGKPLYLWAREGKLSEIEIPAHDVFVEKIEIIKEGIIRGDKLLNKIKKNISEVQGDFRQNEIVNIWQNILEDKKDEEYKTITLRIVCGSGVYVRSIAHEIGVKLKIPALALRIVRTKVGEYKL
jgi:tRNA pseudouridine55 synthase